jgi:hypothetical protein
VGQSLPFETGFALSQVSVLRFAQGLFYTLAALTIHVGGADNPASHTTTDDKK